jgi:predicted nucleic acid-binding protein
MLTTPPKAYLDTHIIIDAECGKISSVEWERVSGYLRQTTRYCLSALTITELLAALAKSDEKYFEHHKRRLRLLLAPCDQPDVFDFIPYFTAQRLGLKITRPQHLEDDFVNTIKLITSAPSKASLVFGFPLPSDPKRTTVKIKLDRFATEFESNQQAYVRESEARRQLVAKRKNSKEAFISIHDWAVSLLLTKFEVTPDADLLGRVAEQFSALYEFEMSFLTLLQNPQFDVSKNLSDLPDAQQLCYLSDPETIFITDDSDFRNRIHTSPQAKRILKFEEVLRRASEADVLSSGSRSRQEVDASSH